MTSAAFSQKVKTDFGIISGHQNAQNGANTMQSYPFSFVASN